MKTEEIIELLDENEVNLLADRLKCEKEEALKLLKEHREKQGRKEALSEVLEFADRKINIWNEVLVNKKEELSKLRVRVAREDWIELKDKIKEMMEK